MPNMLPFCNGSCMMFSRHVDVRGAACHETESRPGCVIHWGTKGICVRLNGGSAPEPPPGRTDHPLPGPLPILPFLLTNGRLC
jgi:hypothetical protein